MLSGFNENKPLVSYKSCRGDLHKQAENLMFSGLSSEYVPADPCQPAGVWTPQPGCLPFQRLTEPEGEREREKREES